MKQANLHVHPSQTSIKSQTGGDFAGLPLGGSTPTRLIVGLSGASGMPFALRMLEVLQGFSIETHLVASKAAAQTLSVETENGLEQARALADHVYSNGDIGAAIASGSFRAHGMFIIPCSVKTLAEIANGIGSSLLSRAADVTLKERRRLVLGVRETPFTLAHLRNMTMVTEMGGIVAPPMPAFYTKGHDIEAQIDHQVQRWLDLMGLHLDLAPRWGEPGTD
ncbi:UbiX family flavin prenyltransferase (plasmid) [Aliiroseovarius crassostreae]|uniref:UbiX family flavin prenyltransferase n=2 Tax=Aliiroseovarius crassostreae TaxID=154981 RepID=UPI00220DA714|nr:UbiX family flavin prenyltransferase [Aliiroseovarius crassostreae]UWQ03540.1 UbiX family flavin prenyltransferase [Aliiroseovarius crassostreae]UWQ12790.1 UbiX family flavin prenyltransferase [Aliiroseovarius crassostreae]